MLSINQFLILWETKKKLWKCNFNQRYHRMCDFTKIRETLNTQNKILEGNIIVSFLTLYD